MERGQLYLAALYRALFASAYYRLLRVSELATDPTGLGSHPVKAVDVHIAVNKRKFLFILRTSKTHWKNKKPQIIKFCGTNPNHANRNAINCPFVILSDFVEARPSCKSVTEPFFVFADHTPITPGQMRGTLRQVLGAAGYDRAAYCTHSFRAGRTCDLLQMGLSVETIKKLDRWTSMLYLVLWGRLLVEGLPFQICARNDKQPTKINFTSMTTTMYLTGILQELLQSNL